MKDLIEALTIFAKYAPDSYSPVHCEHDVMTVVRPIPEEVSEEDKARLDELGFFVGSEYGEYFQSYRFGSA
jgi:hypothetical protein